MLVTLDGVQRYLAAGWSSPEAFKNLIAQPFDLFGKWCEHKGITNPLGIGGVIQDMTRFKEMISGLDFIFNIEKLFAKQNKNLCALGQFTFDIGTIFKIFETVDYLKQVKFLKFFPEFKSRYDWMKTLCGSLTSLCSFIEEWSKPEDEKGSWVPAEEHFSWVRTALSSSGLALTLLYNPMLNPKEDYKLSKLLVSTVLVVAAAVDTYWKGSASQKPKVFKSSPEDK